MKSLRSLLAEALSLLLAVGMIACGPDGYDDIEHDDNFYVQGTVTDSATGNSISGVTVKFGAGTDITDSNGHYAVFHTSGDSISAVMIGYQTYKSSIQLTDSDRGSTITHNIILTPGSSSDIESPSSPSNRIIKPDDLLGRSTTIYWYTSTDNIEVAGYKIYRNNSEIATTLYRDYTDRNVSSNVQYCYSVTSFDASGNESEKSGEMCATPSTYAQTDDYLVPSSIQLKAISPNEITIEWFSDEMWKHNIYRDGLLMKTLNEGENTTTHPSFYYVSYTDSGLSPNTKYCYSISAIKDSGESEQCPQLCITTHP